MDFPYLDGKALRPLRLHPISIIDLTLAAFIEYNGSLGAGVFEVTVEVPHNV